MKLRTHSSGGRARRPARSLALMSLAAGLACLALLPRAGAAPGGGGSRVSSVDTAGLPLPSVPAGERVVLPAVARPFRAGEWLKFSVQYGVIHAGTAYLEVPEVREWQGRPIYPCLALA